jgi:hypothetical protein
MQIQTKMRGWVTIKDPITQEILIQKENQIHYENMSESLAQCLIFNTTYGGGIKSLHFGNGGTSVDPTGIITYLPPNIATQNSSLYNKTYEKNVSQYYSGNADPTVNRVEVRHVPGEVFSDILITCLLNYNEPYDQEAFDTSTDLNSSYTFDEIGVVAENGKLLAHVIFHPFQKSLNRLIQIDYTIRIQTLTSVFNSEEN